MSGAPPGRARPARATVVAALLAVLAVLVAGCATVPGSSDVTVLRRVGDAAEPTAPPGPVRGQGPLETVRGWVLAAGSSADRHEASRQFLTAPAAGAWDDGAAPVVVDDRVDTVFADRVPADGAAVRIRATRLGTLTAAGAFVAQPGPLDLVVGLTQLNGQWRISALPPGVIVRHADLKANTRAVRTWFDGATTGLPVAETRYLQVSPARSVPARTLDLLVAGPSEGLAGAAVSALGPTATLRAADALDPNGALGVEVDGLGAADPARRAQVARSVVLTLAGIGIARARLVADGAPLVGGRAELDVDDVLAGLSPSVRERADLPADQSPTSPTPTTSGQPPVPAGATPLVVVGGRVQTLTDPPSDPTAGGAPGALSAAAGPEGELAVVGAAAGAAPQRLLLGRSGAAPVASEVEGTTLTRPTWAPSGSEVWTVVDGSRLVRVAGAGGGGEGAGRPAAPRPVDAGALGAAGPIRALTLSPDGARVAAVAGGHVLVGAVVRDPAGGVRIGSTQLLHPLPDDAALDGVLDVAWDRSDQVVAVGMRPGDAVAVASVDGLDLDDVPTVNLTPPVTAVAAAAGLPLLVVDQGGLWSFDEETSAVWRSVSGGASGAVPSYPG